MKKTLLILTFFLTTLTVFAQDFEGKIFYSSTYKSNNPQMTDQQWSSMLGSTQEYSIKGTNYKTIANGSLLQWQLYLGKDNKSYTKMASSEVVYWKDASIQDDEVLKAEIHKNATEILGYKCDELILTCKSGVQKYYFNAKIAVNPNSFSKHKFGNWSDYLSKSNALPLKLVIETAQFTIESTATAVEPMQINSIDFELPTGIKTAKSPF